MMTRPMMISCMYVGQPLWLEPLRNTAMMSAPIIEPRMLPLPPFKLAPPITTAAITSSSRPIATEGSPCVSRESCISPPRPKNNPANP